MGFLGLVLLAMLAIAAFWKLNALLAPLGDGLGI